MQTQQTLSKMGRGKRKEENPKEVLEWMTEVQLQQKKLEGKIYERFMNSLKEYLDSNRDPERKHSGPLSVEKLGCDAWENWGKNDGVVCFGLVGPHLLKIYLANPSNLSVYHVLDFVYEDFGLDPEELESVRVDYAMVGSKIYVLFCEATGYTVPVAVYYCDVANPSPYGGDGGYYKWENGPVLKQPKRDFCVFVLDGGIYVLGVGGSKSHKDNSSFEVLKSGSDKWEMLDVPPIFTLYTSIPLVGGTFVDEDAKMFLVRLDWTNISVYKKLNI